MRISVVTVLFNNLEGLKLTTPSIASQSHEDLEWIVIDGGSTDGTTAFVERLGGKIAHFTSEKDKGLYDAMNKGLLQATGDYVIFMNGGDAFASPTALAAVAKAAADGQRPELIFGSSILEFGGRRLNRLVRNPPTYINHGMPAIHQAIAFRRDAHLRHPYDLRYRVTGDYGALAAIWVEGVRWAITDEPISINAAGGASFSHNHRKALYSEPWIIQRDILRLSLHQRIASSMRRRIMTTGFDILGHPAIRRFFFIRRGNVMSAL